MKMELDQRKLKILAAIIETYIRTGEPVGSKFLSLYPEIRVSPATIRNDMAVLFDKGLLEQPHTSAGRIPSHLGYRVYIDQLMECSPLTPMERSEIDALFNIKYPDPDRLLTDAAKSLADYTGCATISTTITKADVKVKKVEILPAGTRTMVIILMASNGVIRNKVCRVDFAVNPEIITFFHKFANGWLAGKSIREITSAYIGSVAVAMGEYSRIFTPVLGAIFELCRELSSGSYYVNGFTNLLAYPELREGAHELFSFLENREQVTRMLSVMGQRMNVIVGRENPNQELTKASVVMARYDIGRDTGSGIIALVGPVRLDYAKMIPHLEYFAQTMGKLLTETIEQDPEDESGLSADY